MQPLCSTMIEPLESRRLLSSPHFIGTPTITDQGTTLNATGSIAGLGNGDVTVTLNATGTGTVICTNPGGKVAPGQTQTGVPLSGSQTITEVKNGRVDFNVTTTEPVAPSDACPNAKWTASFTDIQFSNVSISVEQGGQVVLTFPS